MPTYRLQVSIAADSALPRDRYVITPHFRTDQTYLFGDEPGSLTRDLAEGLSTWLGPTQVREIEVKAYDAQDPAPNRPLGRTVRNANAAPASAHPREVALCLSFYSQFNEPRRRGRLYIPASFVQNSGQLQARPQTAALDKLATLPPILQGLGGANCDWVVYSRADNTGRSVTHWFIDDEWDTQRRRGMRPTTRRTGTTTEAGFILA